MKVGSYINLLTYFLVTVLVAILLILLVLVVVRQKPGRKKMMSYECGFEPFNDARKPFYVNFYNVGLAFLLLDVELMLILPGVWAFDTLTSSGVYWFMFFCFILAVGYIYEFWNQSFKLRR